MAFASLTPSKSKKLCWLIVNETLRSSSEKWIPYVKNNFSEKIFTDEENFVFKMTITVKYLI